MLVAGLAVAVALLHFVTGSHYRGPYPEFVNGYLIDILLPCAGYLLLCLVTHPLLRPWAVKGALVFGLGASVEIAQRFGLPVLGRTYDPVDFAMYAIGVALAAILDTVVLARVFGFWAPEAEGTGP